jgi:riboflavin synthase
MFTGIITDIGIAKEIQKTANTIRLTVETKYDVPKIAMGASISCNGCCLTVVEKNKNLVSFDISPESLEKTNYKNLKVGDKINLEQALKIGEELGGHIVTGHIDCIIEVAAIDVLEGNWRIKFKVPSQFKQYIVTKGSGTINGVSLTINNVENDIFEVNIIPHTLQQTNLSSLKVGSFANFEIDMLARYLEKLIQK